MAYTINLTNGSSLIPGGLSDGSVDTNHTSLVLIGKDYAGYGQFLNENFVYLLENFANNSSPANPLRGQLWWDTANNILRVYSGTSWKISTGATSSPASQPPGDLSTLGGDLWYDSTNAQLKIFTGSNWITVGPQATVQTGNTGAIPAIMTDTTSGNHVVIQLVINGTVYAVISKDTFASNLAGFPFIAAGINFSTTASPAWQLPSPSVLTATSATVSGTATVGTLTATSATIGSMTINTAITPSANVSVNLGSSTSWFNNIYGTAVHAQYADLAERFEADQPLIPGTVVEMGGTAEITSVQADLSENVFGVISTRAAYLMNSQAGSDQTHPPVAVQGRVPVRVVGQVRKGDRLVSAGAGLARAGGRTEINTWNVIGRALADKTSLDEGLVEAVVKLNS
jgi:hypothetical protein